jgi:hypothetical protein
MDDLIFALNERTRSRSWPDRWMTITEIDAELEDRGFWTSVGLDDWSGEGRRYWLRRALATEKETGHAIWLRMGGRYKHFDLVRQDRGDVNDYLTWVAETRQARTRRAEQLLAGDSIVEAVILHPLAGPPEECLRRAEGFVVEVIKAVPDEQVSRRLHSIWSIYEESRPTDVRIGLRVCRLFCAMGTLLAEGHGFAEARPLRRAIRVAESWLDAQVCAAVEEPEEAVAG